MNNDTTGDTEVSTPGQKDDIACCKDDTSCLPRTDVINTDPLVPSNFGSGNNSKTVPSLINESLDCDTAALSSPINQILGCTKADDCDKNPTAPPCDKDKSGANGNTLSLDQHSNVAVSNIPSTSNKGTRFIPLDLNREKQEIPLFSSDTQAQNSENCERNNIIIVDHIPNATEFINSSRILKEVNFYAPNIAVKFAYSLARGGVAIHLHNKQDKLVLLQSLTDEAFGGGLIYDLSLKTQTLFVKGVSVSVTTEHLIRILRDKNIEVTEATRLTQHITGRPLPVIRINCTVESAKTLLQAPLITIRGAQCKVERKQVTVYRCYNCQQLGHIARTCKLMSRCVNCAEHHHHPGECRAASKCVNCDGQHRSSDVDCPAYRQRHEDLTSQRSESKHIQNTTRHSRPETSARRVTATGGVATQACSMY